MHLSIYVHPSVCLLILQSLNEICAIRNGSNKFQIHVTSLSRQLIIRLDGFVSSKAQISGVHFPSISSARLIDFCLSHQRLKTSENRDYFINEAIIIEAWTEIRLGIGMPMILRETSRWKNGSVNHTVDSVPYSFSRRSLLASCGNWLSIRAKSDSGETKLLPPLMQNNDTENAEVKGLTLLPSLKSAHLDQDDYSKKKFPQLLDLSKVE